MIFLSDAYSDITNLNLLFRLSLFKQSTDPKIEFHIIGNIIFIKKYLPVAVTITKNTKLIIFGIVVIYMPQKLI